MSERRTGPFPVDGDVVIAVDGSTWLFDEAVHGYTQEWQQLEPGLSHDEAAAAAAHEIEVRARLLMAMRVHELAAAVCPVVKVIGAHLRRNDPLPTFAELLARAALTDCIAETCDGRPLGLLENTVDQVSAMLSPSSLARVKHMLQRHMLASRPPSSRRPIAGGALRLLKP